MNKKGFIGSIGDDFPSLIPLFFAVLIFFSSLGYSFTTMNDRNDYINTYVDSLKIAKTALGKGNYSSYEDFMQTQESIITTSNYVVGLVYIDKNIFDEYTVSFEELDYDTFIRHELGELVLFEDRKLPDPDGDSEQVYLHYSSSLQDDFEKNGKGINITDTAKLNKVFSYVYPVGLMTSKGVLAAYLIVLVW